jgi:dephospho-CoA kinase
MIIIGLTGSIATGKTFVAKCFAKLGAKVFDADETVHELLTYGGQAVRPVREAFPASYDEGCISRKKLGAVVFGDSASRQKLESIMHPLVAVQRERFLCDARKNKIAVVVLEIPLLFESRVKTTCDYVVVTTVEATTQKARALDRDGMTEQRFNAINALQMDSDEKARRADFVIDTKVSEFSVFRKVKEIMSDIRSRDEGDNI